MSNLPLKTGIISVLDSAQQNAYNSPPEVDSSFPAVAVDNKLKSPMEEPFRMSIDPR